VPVESLLDYLGQVVLSTVSMTSRASHESRPSLRSKKRNSTWSPVRVLLDECVPKTLGRDLPDHEVRTVTEMGWAGTKNGPLLRQAVPEFDVFLTVDQGIEFQQSLTGLDLAEIVMAARTNDIDDLRPLMPRVLAALASARSGDVVVVRA
jgi:hypothetical protein